MAISPLRTNFTDVSTPGPNSLSAAEYNLNATRTNAAHYAIIGATVTGAAADGVTDDTAAFADAVTRAQAQVAYTTGGYTKVAVFIPPGKYVVDNLQITDDIYLFGSGVTLRTKTGSSGYVLVFIPSGKDNPSNGGVRDILIAGTNGASDQASGVHVQPGVWRLDFDKVNIARMAGRAVLDEGIGNKYTNCFFDGWSGDTVADALSSYSGVLEFRGTDCSVDNCEVNANRYAPVSALGPSANMRACALVITSPSASHMISNSVFEQGDHGIYVASGAGLCAFSGARAEYNYGHGWFIEGGVSHPVGSRMSNCYAGENSKLGSNQYDGYHFSLTAGNWQTDNCVANCYSTVHHRYGINDLVQSEFRNSHVNPSSFGHDTAAFYNFGTSEVSWGGALFAFPAGSAAPMAAPTPDVTGIVHLRGNGGTITNFVGGVAGQVLRVVGSGVATTIASNANIYTLTGGSLVLNEGAWHTFILHDGIWRQTYSSEGNPEPRIHYIRDTNGGIGLSIFAETSAVNYFDIHNRVAGLPPYFTIGGPDTNCDFGYATRGTGGVSWYQSSGSTIDFKADGAATDIDWNFVPHGVGRLKESGNRVGSWVAVPSTATSTGKQGQMAADASFLYICTATNTWRRVAIVSW